MVGRTHDRWISAFTDLARAVHACCDAPASGSALNSGRIDRGQRRKRMAKGRPMGDINLDCPSCSTHDLDPPDPDAATASLDSADDALNRPFPARDANAASQELFVDLPDDPLGDRPALSRGQRFMAFAARIDLVGVSVLALLLTGIGLDISSNFSARHKPPVANPGTPAPAPAPLPAAPAAEPEAPLPPADQGVASAKTGIPTQAKSPRPEGGGAAAKAEAPVVKSLPDEVDGRQAAQASIAEKHQDRLNLLSFRKTNGQPFVINGVRNYKMEYEGEVAVTEDCYLLPSIAWTRSYPITAAPHAVPSGLERVKKGLRWKVSGWIKFAMTEGDWRASDIGGL